MTSLGLLCGLSFLYLVAGFPSYRERRDVTYSKCENTYDQCAEWKKNGLCELSNYKEYMTMQCPVACGLCQQDAEGKIDSAKDAATPSVSQAEIAPAPQPPVTQPVAETGYQSAQLISGTQYNPVADSAPYVPPAPVSSDVAQSVEKPSETTLSNSQFASNLLKPEENKDMVSELKKVSTDKMENEEINEGTNENDVSASKHIEREKLKDAVESEPKQPEVKTDEKKEKEKVTAAIVSKKMPESSGFHSGFSGEESGRSLPNFSAEGSAGKELASGSGGLDFDDSIDDLIDLVDDGVDDDLKSDDDETIIPKNKAFPRLSSTVGETVNARSEIVVPEASDSEESGSGSATAGDEDEDSNNQSTDDKEESETEEADGKEEKANEETQKPISINPKPHKAPEEEEKAEKYEDSDDDDDDDKTSSQKNYKKTKQSHGKKSSKAQNLLGQMVDSGKLRAFAVHKDAAQPSNVRGEVEDAKKAQSEEGSMDLAGLVPGLLSGSGLSGSGDGMNTFQVILRQTYDTKYSNEKTPAFQILAGNFENDIEEALGEDSDVSDIKFSEAEIEGNPRIIGKVKVAFKLKGDFRKLQKIIETGNVNGMLVVKNSLEGSILDQ